MKKLLLALGAAGTLVVPSVQAALEVTLYQDTSAYSSGSGGEFRAVVNADLAAFVDFNAYAATTKGTQSGLNYFQTFCIEHNENFSPGTTYNVNGISNNAMYGGAGSPGDPISKGTAWLYYQFAQGILTGYNYAYGATRTTTAADLQNAIWFLEGEGGANNYYVTAAIAGLSLAAGDVTGAMADANGLYGVYALNIGAPGAVQDQLVIGTPVPEPSTIVAGILLLLPFGASTIRILRKNRVA